MSGKLTDGIVPPRGDPTLADMQPQAQPQPVPPDVQMVTVFLVNGTRTSQGPGPGVKTLPSPEANALISAKLAIYGSEPPAGMGGVPESPVRAFNGAGTVSQRAAQSN